MRTSLTLLVLFTFVLGVAFVGNALAQPFDGGTPVAEPAPTLEAAGEVTPDPVPADPEARAEATPAPESVVEQGKGFYKSLKGGHWLLAFGFFGMILGAAARFTIGKKWKFLKSKAGGYTIASFTGLGVLGMMIVEAGAFSISMLTPAILAMTAAMAMHGPAKAVVAKIKPPAEA